MQRVLPIRVLPVAACVRRPCSFEFEPKHCLFLALSIHSLSLSFLLLMRSERCFLETPEMSEMSLERERHPLTSCHAFSAPNRGLQSC